MVNAVDGCKDLIEDGVNGFLTPVKRPLASADRILRLLADPAMAVWSFGEIPVVRGAFLESRIAPDFSVPDRQGRLVRLSQFRKKKVLVVTWASW